MNSEDFNKCREFLQKSYSDSPENSKLLEAYMQLCDNKSTYDKETDKARIENEIRATEANIKYNTEVYKSNNEIHSSEHSDNVKYDMAKDKNDADVFMNGQNNSHSTERVYVEQGCIPRSRRF